MAREAEFPFLGSPVVSVSIDAALFLPQRYERFAPFGAVFRTPGGEYQLYETPHGVMASRKQGGTGEGTYVVYVGGKRRKVRVKARGALGKKTIADSGKSEDSLLYRTALGWSQFFDECLNSAHGTKRENKLRWQTVLELITRVAKERKEPRMALIVDIARKMHRRVGFAVSAARKVLVRERRFLPAGRIEETDTTCLKWYVRQPGETMAQKAAANRQSLLGVARSESFDTVENQVLKDFLVRCRREAARYWATEIGNDPTMQLSVKASDSKAYEQLCSLLASSPHLRDVSLPNHRVRPNYVLQNDLRYREVWRNYLRLLRQEDQQDSIWDWQGRTWADVARLLVNAALYQMATERERPGQHLRLQEKLTSAVHFLREPHLGSRIIPGSEPGPFEVKLGREGRERRFILEVVHSQEAADHSATASLGRMGGHLYLVLTPLGVGRRKVVVMWAVHSAGSQHRQDSAGQGRWRDMVASAKRALERHVVILEERNPNFPETCAFIVASDLGSEDADLHGVDAGEVPLLQVGIDQRRWDDALAGMITILEYVLENAL